MKKEPYTNDSTFWKNREIKFESSLGSSGIYVTVYEKLTKEEQEDFKKHLKSERDLVSIKFK